MVEIEPGFVEDEQAGAAVKSLPEPMEDVSEHRACGGRRLKQVFHLETGEGRDIERVMVAVEQAPVGPLQRERQERGFELGRLQQQAEAGQCALFGRRRGKRLDCFPERGSESWVERETFAFAEAGQPAGGKCRPGLGIDGAQRLQGGQAVGAERQMGAAHGEHGRARRAALVEDEHLRAGITRPVEGQHREQD